MWGGGAEICGMLWGREGFRGAGIVGCVGVWWDGLCDLWVMFAFVSVSLLVCMSVVVPARVVVFVSVSVCMAVSVSVSASVSVSVSVLVFGSVSVSWFASVSVFVFVSILVFVSMRDPYNHASQDVCVCVRPCLCVCLSACSRPWLYWLNCF